MNRAWIPAGALASVSVAGLIALGPLTDSLGTSVSFPISVPVATDADKPGNASVPVSVTLSEAVGSTETAALRRGGPAQNVKAAAPTTTEGQVGYRKRVTPAPSVTVTVKPKAPVVKPAKKKPKRQNSIGTTGETNGDNGLAGSGQGSQGQGETSSTLAP
jgi:hypothetical protein